MNLQQVFEAGKFLISDGSTYGWSCFGPNACLVDFSSSPKMLTNVASVTFDRVNQTVYNVEVFFVTSDSESKDTAFRWINPEYIRAYRNESYGRGVPFKSSYDGIEFIDKDNETEILEILKLAMSYPDAESCGDELKTYINTCLIEIDLNKDQLLELMVKAHERDITFNQYMGEVLQLAVENAEKIIKENDKPKTAIFEDETKEAVSVNSFVNEGEIFTIFRDKKTSKIYLKNILGQILVMFDKDLVAWIPNLMTLSDWQKIGNLVNDPDTKFWSFESLPNDFSNISLVFDTEERNEYWAIYEISKRLVNLGVL